MIHLIHLVFLINRLKRIFNFSTIIELVSKEKKISNYNYTFMAQLFWDKQF